MRCDVLTQNSIPKGSEEESVSVSYGCLSVIAVLGLWRFSMWAFAYGRDEPRTRGQ